MTADPVSQEDQAMAREFAIAISGGPKCPACGCQGFDDWWHDPTCRGGIGIVRIHATLKCHGCGKFFAITQYDDGEVHSTMNRRKSA